MTSLISPRQSTPGTPSTKEEILRYLLKHDRVTAQTLAESLGISPQAVRRHLNDLEECGLVTHQVTPAKSMGRPQYLYSLTPRGKSQFPKRYGEFSVNLLQSLSRTVGQESVRQLLHQQWQDKAQYYKQLIGHLPLAERVEQLALLRRQEGYITEWFPQNDRAGFIYTEYNCVIAEVATSFPHICSQELEMFSEIFQEFKVDRIHWLVGGEHFCGYSICQ
ncbi:MAG: iron-sulfur cluster biosynthesis transcriptional regulator SufR [Pseudanabaenaceae cyanobacterium SKYGB_i_bin29]|nr:iron-sulfur cluster biosynthesis transcriptional regulator SufR [Pseudanabaenaceae cyanobacterium SKYG29]MDW8420616.1 iron-sulfur cluster biosynthesis transcriptional regulator SufR [Pseudanabaenaceae cyanobacterium SKYGB_i_bin29]